MGNKVELKKTVSYQTLETALVNAAKEVGWKARVQDEFRERYRLGSVEVVQDYDYTLVHLRGRIFPVMKVYIANKGPADSFYVWADFLHGIISKKRIQEYLNAVSKNL